MLCVSQALVASEAGDWRSAWATQSLPLKSPSLQACGHFQHLFLLKGQTRVGYCIRGVKAAGFPRPWALACLVPRAQVCVTGPSVWSYLHCLLFEACHSGTVGLLADPTAKTNCESCCQVTVYRAEGTGPEVASHGMALQSWTSHLEFARVPLPCPFHLLCS